MGETSEQERLANLPKVSVIIPTFNSEGTIARCLKSIRNQTYPNIETIVVDSYSEDNTVAIAKKLKSKILLLKAERSQARNFGAKQARGDFLFFVDSDMELTSRVVEECVALCFKEKVDAVIIPEFSIGTGFLVECRKMEKEMRVGESFCEAPRFFRRDTFNFVRGYDESLVSGEDFDLGSRVENAGYKIRRCDAEIKHHEGELSMKRIVLKTYYYGETLPLYVRKNLSLAMKTSCPIRFFKNLRFFIKQPTCFVGLIFIKILDYIAYFLGFFATLFKSGVSSGIHGIERLRNVAGTKRGLMINFSIIVILGMVIFRHFLFSSEWPAGGDTLGFISRAYIFGKDFRWLYLWRPYSFGFVEGIFSLDFFCMLIHFFSQDAASTAKIFLFCLFLMAGFSMTLFAYHYTKNHLAALSASLTYILNPWFFSQFTEAHSEILFSYAFAPILFLLLDNTLRNGRSKEVLGLSLALMLFVTGFYPQCIVIYGLFLAIFILVFVLIPSKSSNMVTRVKRVIKTLLPSSIVTFLLAAFWFVPLISNVKVQYLSASFGYPVEFIYGYESIGEAFVLGGTEVWGYFKILDAYGGVGMPGFPNALLVALIFCLAYCTFLLRKDRYSVFFAVSAVISIFLAKGDKPPFGDIFTWAWFNIPHFSVFRASSRWVMMAAFSHSFFISVLVKTIVDFVRKKTHLEINQVFLSIKTPISDFGYKHNQIQEFDSLLEIARRLLVGLYKSLYYVGIMLLSVILLSGFLSCFYFFDQGLQTYARPESYMAPYEWIAKQEGDYKVVTVAKSAAEWMEWEGAQSDFGSSAMLTNNGWGHDIGFDSAFIHDKPVLQDGGWQPLSRAYVDYLRLLAREYASDNLLKILGVFNYKYVVIPSYASASMQNFFLNQRGGRVVYNQSGSVVIENPYCSPYIYGTVSSALVVGGLETVSSLSKIDALDLNQLALIFAHQLEKPILQTLLKNSDAFVFAGADMLDLIMPFLRDDVILIKASEHAPSSINTSSFWVSSNFWRNNGELVVGQDTLTTVGRNNVTIPFEIESDGTYDLLIRVGFGPLRGNLKVLLDGVQKLDVHPESTYWVGLQWLNITHIDLKNGHHAITLVNDGSGFNDVDAIAIVEYHHFSAAVGTILNVLGNFNGRFVHVFQAEKMFDSDTLANWFVVPSLYSGQVLETDGINVSPEGRASASSIQSEDFEAQKALDGVRDTRWASSFGTPQWVQVEWLTPKELTGVKIVFETAFAKNYQIQTWNGTNWETQVNVTENTLLTRFHPFDDTVCTTKLRVYITTLATEHNLVSIRELESQMASKISTRVFIPKKGYYMLALRLDSGPEFGALNMKIGNFTQMISCSSSGEQFDWYEVGPVFFDIGEQTIAVAASGVVRFDEMIIYSLKNNENNLSLAQLFQSNSTYPSVSYEKINSCKYTVHVNAKGPFLLVFSESYHPLWRAFVDDKEISPVVAYSVVNGFFINKTGAFDVTIYFTGQDYAEIGLKISAVTLAVTSAYLVMYPSAYRRLRTKLRWTKRSGKAPKD